MAMELFRAAFPEGNKMDLQKGDHVMVNAAPFIGSQRRNRESIPCRILTVHEAHVEVQTEFPYREFSLWVGSDWVDRKLEPHEVEEEDSLRAELGAVS
jgi:hypothetical protein